MKILKNIPKPDEIYLTVKQVQEFLQFVFGNDLDFYEQFIMNLSESEQEKFFDESPEFMNDYPISRKMMYLLRDESFRNILRKIESYEKNKHK